MRWWTRSFLFCLIAKMGGLRYSAVRAGAVNVEHIRAIRASHGIEPSWSGREAYTNISRSTWYGSEDHWGILPSVGMVGVDVVEVGTATVKSQKRALR